MTEKTQPSVAYIAGYGRSGSTILGILLGAHKGFHHMGAIAHLPNLAVSNEITCSCGRIYRECKEWQNHIPDNPASIKALSRHMEGMPGLRGRFASAEQKRNYRTYWSDLLAQIQSNHSAKLLIDTSKTSYTSALRPVALRRILGLDVHLILLVRDARDVMNSKLKGNNNKLSRKEDGHEFGAGIKGLIGWLLANTYGLICCMAVGRKRRFVVYYDDLMKNPPAVIHALGQFLNEDLSDVITQMNSDDGIEPGHLVGGNRLARREKVRFSVPKNNHAFLKVHHHILYWVLTLPLNLVLRSMRQGRAKDT